jgi:glycerol-3-phosphate dehydrogenase subunit B
MPSADVVVIGAGLSGLTVAIELAERGARVHLVAKGMAATHWAHGGLDIAAPHGATTSAKGIEALQARAGHPYAVVAGDAGPALERQLARLAKGGLPYVGRMTTPLRPFPTAVGGLRPAAVVPAAQAAALKPWRADEGLVLLGFERFRDAWPGLAARNLSRQPWPKGPARIEAASVALTGLESLHNLSSLTLARRFDDPAWRDRALDAMRAALPAEGTWRIGVPAVLGLADHAAALATAADRLGHPVFEIPTLPPSVPGLRLFDLLRARAVALGVTVQIGFEVAGLERDGTRITAVETRGAARPMRIATGQVVLATGGIAGGGFRGNRDGTITDAVAGLPVTAPGRGSWLAGDLYGAQGVALETAGIVVDGDLRPVGPAGRLLAENLRVVGSALAGMQYLSERCGDGVAMASAHRAASLCSDRDASASAHQAVAS